MAFPNDPPPNYRAPRFPSLNVKTLSDTTIDKNYTLFYLSDVVRFTVIWTLIVYALFHLGAVLVAFSTHGLKKSSWKYLWVTPVVYLSMAAFEAVLSGSIVGLVYVPLYFLHHEAALTFYQFGRRLPRRILRNEYLDSLHLGLH